MSDKLHRELAQSLALEGLHLRLVPQSDTRDFEEDIDASLEIVRSVIAKLESVESNLLKLREECWRANP